MPDSVLKKKISEVDPMGPLGNVTAPLDNLWKAVGQRLNIQSIEDIKSFFRGGDAPRALKSSLGSDLASQDTSNTVWRVLGIAKSAFVLIANIFVAILEIVLWLLRGVLGLIS